MSCLCVNDRPAIVRFNTYFPELWKPRNGLLCACMCILDMIRQCSSFVDVLAVKSPKEGRRVLLVLCLSGVWSELPLCE